MRIFNHFSYLLVVAFLSVITVFSSCQKDEIEIPNDESNSEQTNNESIVDGRLSFQDKSSLENKLLKLKEQDIEISCEQMGKLYDKGFKSMQPLIYADDVERATKHINQRPKFKNVFQSNSLSKTKSTAEQDSLVEQIIGDDEFASMLNENGEIQVGDSIYKYTETGLYFVHKDDIEHLNSYLEKNANEIFTKAELQSKTKVYGKMSRRLFEDIDEKITRFTSRRRSTYTGGTYNDEYTPTLRSLPANMREQVEYWTPTAGRQTQIAGWFGDRRVAYETVKTRRRVKVIFSNQDLYLSHKVFIEVKYQKKFLGIWFARKADELFIAVNNISYTINHNMPDIYNLAKTTWYWENRVFNEHMQDITWNVQKYPDIPFASKIKVVVNLKKINSSWPKVSHSLNDLRKLGYDYLSKKFMNFLKGLGRNPDEANEITMVALDRNQIHVVNMDMTRFKRNNNNLRRTYETAIRTPKIVYIPSANRWNIDMMGVTKDFDYETLSVDFCAGIRSGDTWYGRRLKFSK